jgi:hypothetical protein
MIVHKDFVLFGTPQSVLNSVSNNIPTLLLASFFGAATSGLFWLAYRLLMLPTLVLTENLRSVLYQRLAELHHKGGDLRPMLWRSSLQLFLLCLPIATVLVVFGPVLFSSRADHRPPEADAVARDRLHDPARRRNLARLSDRQRFGVPRVLFSRWHSRERRARPDHNKCLSPVGGGTTGACFQ